MEQFLGLPPDGSAHGAAIDQLIAIVHWLMVVLFVGWGTFYIFTLIRFRKSRNPVANYHGVKSHFSNYLEVAVLLIEVILLVGFSIPIWSNRVDDFPAEKDATVVRIVGEQFAWNVHYPGPDGKFGKTSVKLVDTDNPLGLDRSDPDAKDDIVTNNNLNLPVNKPVLIYLSSKDVIHSFSLPMYRVKHDAIPGERIPVWFTPVKTTDQIREELRRTFSIADAMKKVKQIVLPAPAMTNLAKGMSMDNQMVMEDVPDTAGGTILSKGDHLTAENVGKLMDAGTTQIRSRAAAGLDKYVSTKEYKDTSGAMIVGRGDPLNEDAVTKLVMAGTANIEARRSSNMDGFVLMEPYADKSGTAIAAKGDALSEDVIGKLADAGIMEVALAPATPTEIACAQLCGLGHFRMRGYVNVESPEDFQKWYNDQEAALQAASQPADSASAGAAPASPDSTSTQQETGH